MIIAHIDMNCFYASVEEKYNPSLKGKPLAVAGEEIKRHGIIVTSNYEARKKGIKTTMRVGEAKKTLSYSQNSITKLCKIPKRIKKSFLSNKNLSKKNRNSINRRSLYRLNRRRKSHKKNILYSKKNI